MPEDHIRFRCYQCNQLLGASFKRAGSVITCPRCATELKVPRPDEQTVTAEASRSGHGFNTESRVPESSTATTSRSGGNSLPSFMEEIAAAIPDDLATLRPEDIRVEAEFVDLVVTTSEKITAPAPAAEVSLTAKLPGDPVELEAYFSQHTSPADLSPAVPAERPSVYQAQPVPVIVAPPTPMVPVQPSSMDPQVDAAIGTVLPAINIDTPSLLPRAREFQPVSEVILQPATVLAWSLLVLLALPMAFLAGLLIGHFVWK